jgi:tRNA U34 2-thiouridine synthase MnmA/TrmU
MSNVKAIALLSGGLDSTLAAKLIKEQGIEIIVLNLKTIFCLCDKRSSSGCSNEALKVSRDLGLEIKIINVTNEILEIIKNPQHGFGSRMNPCIDCRILSFRKAKELMLETGARFVITGEVLGQRPMSQHRQALATIEKESGLEGLILRPLSAKLFDETLAEKKGWVLRDKLLDFSGRARRPQIALAKSFGIKDYPCSSGGCLLTDPGFSRRIKDLLNHGELNINAAQLLKVGRHFRLAEKTKLIVARNEKEGEALLQLAVDRDIIFEPKELAGPTAILRGNLEAKVKLISAQIIARYTKPFKNIKISRKTIPEGEEEIILAQGLEKEKLAEYII